MAFQTRSTVLAVKEETTEGELIQPAAGSEFTVLREGFTFEGAVENIETDELVNDIGQSKSFISKEVPAGTLPHYWKHSGVEGQEPDYGIIIESSLGAKVIVSTESVTDVGSTAGSSTAAPVIVTTALNELERGMAVLIKDGTNGFSIRNITAVSDPDITLNYNLSAAPASGVDLGKAVLYKPAATGHPTYSAHLFQASVNSANRQSIAGCRTTEVAMNMPANEFAEMNFSFEGIEFFYNPIVIDSTNFSLDFNDGGGEENAVIEQKTYKSPVDLAREIESKMNALTGDTITVIFNSTGVDAGKFNISTSGGVLSLLWDTGTNTATTIGTTIGFDVASDDTGATTYTSDNEQSYDPAFTPVFDAADALVVKENEIFIGDFTRNDCRQASVVTVTVGTPKSDVDDICAVSGVSESLILEREVTLAATLYLQKHEVSDFDNFINNTTTQMMFNGGTKTGGNFDAGKSINVFLESASITANVVADEDGIQVVNVEASAFVTSSTKDVFINFL